MGDYKVNFFRPANEMTRTNNRLIASLIILWAVGVFGFQIALQVLNTPTPEAAHKTFVASWEQTDITAEQKAGLTKAFLAVLGKNVAVSQEHKELLTKAAAWAVASLDTPDMEIQSVSRALGLDTDEYGSVYTDILEFYLPMEDEAALLDLAESFDAQAKAEIPVIMDLYLIHNQSVLTDTNFMGFPFHYWYTAQFLLMMFVGICFVYARATDRLHTKFKFVEKE